MNNTNEPVGSTTGLSTLQRARFGPGMLLQHEDLEQLNTYTRDLSRLLFQSFFGCGVICGLVVEAVPECDKLKVSVQPGVALSCSGDPVYVPGPKPTDVFTKPSFDLASGKDLWVVLCGTTKCCAPRTTTCCSDDDEATSDCTREKDGFEIRIYQARPDCACGCPPKDTNQSGAAPGAVPNQEKENFCKCVDPKDPCYEDHYAGKCGCTCGDCSGCDCKCILLAHLRKTDDTKNPWKADHSVRRYIRPGLIVDQQIEKDKEPQPNNPTGQEQPTALPMIRKRIADLKEEQRILQAEEKRLKQEQKLQQQPVVAATGTGGPNSAQTP